MILFELINCCKDYNKHTVIFNCLFFLYFGILFFLLEIGCHMQFYDLNRVFIVVIFNFCSRKIQINIRLTCWTSLHLYQ